MIKPRSYAYAASSLLAQVRRLKITTVFAMSIANAVLGLAMTALLARMLGPAEYGRYSFILSILTILTVPIAYGLRQTVLRETSYAHTRGTEYPKHLWFWACKVAVMISLPIAVTATAWSTQSNTQLLESTTIIIAFITAMIFTPLVHVAIGALQGLGAIVRSQTPDSIIKPATSLILIISFAVLLPNSTFNRQTALSFYATSVIVAGAYGFYHLHKIRPTHFIKKIENSITPKRQQNTKLLITVASFSAISILQVGNDNIDTILLAMLDQPEAVGHYRVAVSLSTIVSLAIIAVNTVTAPLMARLWISKQFDELQRLVSQSTAITILISLLALLFLTLFGDIVIQILFGKQYDDAIFPLLILSLGRCIASAMGPMTSVLNQSGHERYMFAGLALAISLNLILNLILIPIYSSLGAAIAAAIALVAFSMFVTISVYKKTGITANPFHYK